MDRYTNESLACSQDQILLQGPLPEALARIGNAASQAREIGHKLSAHADRLFGSQPEGATAASKPREVRDGMIGQLSDALDNLDEALSYMATQAGRNCNLA